MINLDLAKLGFDIIKLVLSPLIALIKWIGNIIPFQLKWKKSFRLGLIESSRRQHFWNYEKRGEKQVISIHTFWTLTNTLPYNLTALNVVLLKPVKVKGHWMVKDTESDYWGMYTIKKGFTTEIEIWFFVEEKATKNTQADINVVIEITDPIGNIHKSSQITVKKKEIVAKQDEKKNRIEDPSKIKSNVERQVVAVLKNELRQYEHRGRRSGHLGTVEWPRGTLEWTGVDEQIKFLNDSSIPVSITSTHISALLNLYDTSSQASKSKIVRALLSRLDNKSEYKKISYIIVFFLFEVDRLKESLEITLKNIHDDEGEHSLSEVLNLIDKLLAFRFEEFQEIELKAIDEFVSKCKSHPFRIKERINAIYVAKMQKVPTKK